MDNMHPVDYLTHRLLFINASPWYLNTQIPACLADIETCTMAKNLCPLSVTAETNTALEAKEPPLLNFFK